jgi:hypothetical protein
LEITAASRSDRLASYTLLDPEVTPSVPTTSNTAKWAQPCKAPRRGLIAHAWLSVICGGTSGRRCRWIRRVDGLDCDMPMRFLRPFAKWSHDGSGRRSRDRSWQSDPEICPQRHRQVSISFSGFIHLGDYLNRVSLHVEDTRGEDTMWGAVRSRSLPHASKAPRQGWN